MTSRFGAVPGFCRGGCRFVYIFQSLVVAGSHEPRREALAKTALAPPEEQAPLVPHGSAKDDLTQLYKRVRNHLNLAPDDQSEQVFNRILGNCESIVNSLGSLRNKIGDAHSTGTRRVKPAPRHAALAVNLAGTMAKFLIETWEAKARGAAN